MNKLKITIDNGYGLEVSATVDVDTPLSEIMEAVSGLLVLSGFHGSTVAQCMREEGERLADENKNNTQWKQ